MVGSPQTLTICQQRHLPSPLSPPLFSPLLSSVTSPALPFYSTTSSSLHMIPTLPPEIVDEILRDNRLSKGDLKRCCLVKRDWLESAQRSLYDHIDVHAPSCDAGEASDNDIDDPGEEFYNLDQASSHLFATLLYIRALGYFVNSITISSDETKIATSSGSKKFRIGLKQVLINFAQLCPNVKEYNNDHYSYLDDVARIRSRWPDLERIGFFALTQEIWENLDSFESLERLTADEIELDSSQSPEAVHHLAIVGLEAPYVRSDDFTFMQSSISQSLRDLHVDVQLVSVLRLSNFPHLTRLSIGSRGGIKSVKTRAFLKDLSTSTSLRIFELDDNACLTLRSNGGDLGRFLPRTCLRVNLFPCTSSDSVLSTIQESTNDGHRIRKLGLPSDLQDEDDKRSRLLLVAVRALLEAAGVELIWID